MDLGTGSAIWGIELAKRGWQVVGVDIVEKALRRAREQVLKAGVNMRLVRTKLDVSDPLHSGTVGAVARRAQRRVRQHHRPKPHLFLDSEHGPTRGP